MLDEAKKYWRRYSRQYRPLSKEDEEDVIQEIAIALIKAERRFDPSRANWQTYAEYAARGAVYDYFRNDPTWIRSERRFVFVTSYDQLVHESAYNDNYEALDIVDTIGHLGEKDRFIALCLIHGYLRAEIAEMLNVTKVNIYQRSFRLVAESLRY